MEYIFTSSFGPDMYQFLELKVALKYSKKSYDWTLHNIDTFANNNYPNLEILSKEFVEEWIKFHKPNITQNGQRARLIIVRDFALYLHFMGKEAYILDSQDVPRRQQYVPHLFTDDELKAFFKASDNLPVKDNNSHKIIPVLFRMMYCSAMRPGEPLNLLTEDVDLDNGYIIVRNGKRHTDRTIKMSKDLLDFCRKYNNLEPQRKYFFCISDNKKIPITWTMNLFGTCWIRAGLGTRKAAPRQYDFRHSAASRILLNWINDGKDVMVMLPYLQAQMGHKNIKDTLYYVHLLPEHIFNTLNVDWDRFKNLYPEITNETIKK